MYIYGQQSSASKRMVHGVGWLLRKAKYLLVVTRELECLKGLLWLGMGQLRSSLLWKQDQCRCHLQIGTPHFLLKVLRVHIPAEFSTERLLIVK